MELGVILEAIATVGFPIVMVLALGYFVYKLWQQSVEREKILMGEITENRLVNQQFAEIIAKYEITLGEIKNDVKDIKDTLHINN
jgi:uncharacterized membrane protein YukC